jgi:hypothetical protein
VTKNREVKDGVNGDAKEQNTEKTEHRKAEEM